MPPKRKADLPPAASAVPAAPSPAIALAAPDATQQRAAEAAPALPSAVDQKMSAARTGHTAPERKKQKGAEDGDSDALKGTLSMVRREAAALASARGMRVVDSVSASTDVVVCGSGAGAKLDLARRLGKEVWSEAEFKARVTHTHTHARTQAEEPHAQARARVSVVGAEGARAAAATEKGARKWVGAEFRVMRDTPNDWTDGCECPAEISDALVKRTLDKDTSEAARIAIDIARLLDGVIYECNEPSDWYPFVISGFSNPGGDHDPDGIIRSALGVADSVPLISCAWEEAQRNVFLKELKECDDIEQDKEQLEQKHAATELMRRELRHLFGLTWPTEAVCYLRISGGWLPDGSAVAGVFAIVYDY